MRPDNPANETPSERLIRLQCEANERLVLAGIRAYEEVDEAVGARRRAEIESEGLKAREEALRLTAEFRERLIGIIGHDLRSPLQAIVMSSGLLIAHGDLTDSNARLVGRILNSGHRMKRMITQLVEFTRARLGGGFILTPKVCNLGDICRNIAEEIRIGSSADVRDVIEGNLRGTWDGDRLAEAIANIAGNAVEHAAPGTSVLIHTFEEADGVAVEITNRGVCIPPALLPEIFNAFRSAGPGVRSRTGHLGLGLYIASEIVRAHGGTLRVRSSDGSTTFTVRLPRLSRGDGSAES